MSVIVWDGRTLAADRQATDGSGATRRTTKIFRRAGLLYAITGELPTGLALIDWHQSGAARADWPGKDGDATLIAIHPDGRVQQWDGSPHPHDVIDVPCAWGAGAYIALGALAMGADAERAVSIACQRNAYCGMGIDVLPLAPAEGQG